MLFGQYVIDKTIEEYVTEIGDLATDPRTLIFIDTNVVSYLYKLHEAARREFFAWLDGIAAEGRFFVPTRPWQCSGWRRPVHAASASSTARWSGVAR